MTAASVTYCIRTVSWDGLAGGHQLVVATDRGPSKKGPQQKGSRAKHTKHSANRIPSQKDPQQTDP